MNEALDSILCEHEQWTWEPHLNYFLKFNRDGTGEMWCMQEHSYLCALNLEWKTVAQPAAAIAQRQSGGRRQPQVLGTFQLDITLLKSLAKGMSSRTPDDVWIRANERNLRDTAYKPKSFTVTMEKGNFVPASRIGHEDKTWKLRYGLRLLFNQSPFPALDDWNWNATLGSHSCPPVGPADRDQPPMLEFVARQLPKDECRGTAMNDSNSWGSCVVS